MDKKDRHRQREDQSTNATSMSWMSARATKVMSMMMVEAAKVMSRVSPTQSNWRIWDPATYEAHVVLRGVIVRNNHDMYMRVVFGKESV